jgi:hypothetical protein
MAVLTPTIIQKEIGTPVYGVSGTPVRIEKFYIQVTKAAQNDTIEMDASLGEEYTTDKIIALDGITIPGSGDTVQEAPTVDDSDDEIVLPSATTGTTWVTVTYGL